MSQTDPTRQFRRRSLLHFLRLAIIGFCVSFAIASCQLTASSNPSSSVPQTQLPQEVRMGIQPSAGHLYVLRESGNLEQRLAAMGISLKWVEFPAGPQMMEALGKNEIDFGYAGGLPPIFAQARDIPVVYIANEPPSPQFLGFLVRANSPIKTLADLKGKKVTTNNASITHYLLFQGLRASRLTFDDIEFVPLPPKEGQEAFKRGKVDVWVGWYPFLAQVQQAVPSHLLASNQGLVSAREYYVTSRSFAENHSDLIPLVMKEARAIGLWTNSHRKKAAEILAASTQIDRAIALKTLANRTNGATQIQDRAIEEQQRIADTFFRLGLLPEQILVEDAVWKGKLSN